MHADKIVAAADCGEKVRRGAVGVPQRCPDSQQVPDTTWYSPLALLGLDFLTLVRAAKDPALHT